MNIFWEKHKWKTSLGILLVLVLSIGGMFHRETIETHLTELKTESKKTMTVTQDRDEWQKKAEKYQRQLTESEEEVPFFHPVTGAYIGLRTVKKKSSLETGTSDLERQIAHLTVSLEENFQLGYQKGKSEKISRPALRRVGVGAGWKPIAGSWTAHFAVNLAPLPVTVMVGHPIALDFQPELLATFWW